MEQELGRRRSFPAWPDLVRVNMSPAAAAGSRTRHKQNGLVAVSPFPAAPCHCDPAAASTVSSKTGSFPASSLF